jgi:hypothetical protein
MASDGRSGMFLAVWVITEKGLQVSAKTPQEKENKSKL